MPSTRLGHELSSALKLLVNALLLIGCLYLGNYLLARPEAAAPTGNPLTTGLDCQQFLEGVVCR